MRQWRFGEIREFTDAGNGGAPVCDVVGTTSPHLVDLLGDIVDRLPEPTAGLDLLKMRPCLRGKGFGESLDVPRAAGGVENAADAGLLEQQQLGVAGNPPGEVNAHSGESARDRRIEWQDLHRVGSPDARTKRCHGGAHHIHPGIPLSHHRRRRDRMYRRSAVIGAAQHVGHPCPQLPGRTELRDGHELVIVGGQPEADLMQCVEGSYSGSGLQAQVVKARAEHTRQFPGGAGPTVVESRSVDGDRPHAALAGHGGGHRKNFLDSAGVGPTQSGGERVGTEVDRHRRAPCVVGSGHQGKHRPGRDREMRTGVQHYRREFEVHTLQPTVELPGRHPAGTDTQHQRTHAVDKRAEYGGIALRGGAGEVRRRELLGYLPAGQYVTVAVSAAHERPLTRQRRFAQSINRGVERVNLKALVGRRVQQSLRFVGEFGPIPSIALGNHLGDGTAPPRALQFYRHRRLPLSRGSRRRLVSG